MNSIHMKSLFFLIVVAIHCSIHSAETGQALNQNTSLQQSVLGVWRVKVSGENRERELTVYRSRQPADTHISVDAVYGWADSKPAVVNAKIMVNGERALLTVVTPAASTITAWRVNANTMEGKFETKSGDSKDVVLSKIFDYSNPHTSFGDEDKDFHISPTSELSEKFHHPTPLSVPGAKTIRTLELMQILESNNKTILVDVLGVVENGKKQVIPSAFWLGPYAGSKSTDKQRLAVALERITSMDKSAALIFYCGGIECWASYNASLRAVEFGYSNVLWYRGGATAWAAAKLPTVVAVQYSW